MVKYTQVAPVIYGAGSINCIGENAKALGMTKVMLVHGKSVTKNGTLEKVQKSLDEAEIAYLSFDEVSADAPDTIVNKGGQLAKDENVNGIIAIGGGSALDAAKAMDILVTNPLPVSNYYMNPFYEKPAPLICVPTTSGTGSESTMVGVIYDTENNYKNVIIRGCELAILDPELTLSAPAHVTAGCAMDAFAHALEAVTSRTSNPRSDVLGYDAIKKITQYLPIAYKDGSDLEARSQLILASNFAGTSFGDAGVHIGHAISHSFGVAFHMAHGEGCALTLPLVMKLALEACPEKLIGVSEAMGLKTEDKNEAYEFCISKIRELFSTCGIKSLKEREISLEAAVACAEYASNEGFAKGACPVEYDVKKVEEFITDIYNF